MPPHTSPQGDDPGVVVIGAGQAGGRLAEALRQNGYVGAINLIGEEPHLPYERPSLSKELLLKGTDDQIVWVQQPSFYEDQEINVWLGARAERIDREQKLVLLADGKEIPFQHLVIATGARARRLDVPAEARARAFTIRTIEDSLAARGYLEDGNEILIIGAGFIGLEVAAIARARGCAVTVFGSSRYPMQRCVPQDVGSHFFHLHRANGVTMEMEMPIHHIDEDGGRPVVVTMDGRRLVGDALIIGVGAEPDVELAAAAGLDLGDGIRVGPDYRTSDPSIFAIGDVASRYDERAGRWVRPESWHAAQSQAVAVARTITGVEGASNEVPWIWTDQYDQNLQIYGFAKAGHRIVERGRLGEGPAIRFYLEESRVAAAIGVNAGRDIRVAREMIAAEASPPANDLSNPSLKMVDIWRSLRR